MISPDPGLPLGREGITDPCFRKCSLQVCSSVLHTTARCRPGLYGKLHKYYCRLYLTHALVAYGVVGASVALMLAFTAPILMLHTLTYKNGLALLWRSDYVWCECRVSYCVNTALSWVLRDTIDGISQHSAPRGAGLAPPRACSHDAMQFGWVLSCSMWASWRCVIFGAVINMWLSPVSICRFIYAVIT